MTTPAGLNDAECDAILRHTPYLCTDPHRTIVRAAYAAGQAAASVPLLATIERMRVAAMMQDWDEFNAALHDAAPAVAQGEKP